MTGTNSSNNKLILRQNVEINSNWCFFTTYFREWNCRLRGMETPVRNHQEKCRECKDIPNTNNMRFIMVYQTIIDVILHLFIIFYDLWCQIPFLKKFLHHNGSAVFGKMPQMSRGCPDVNKCWGMDTAILRQHRAFMSIKSFVQHNGWQEMVSLCWLFRLIGVWADCDQPEFLCSRSDSRYLEVHVATAGGWLTHYRLCEVRNSIYRYQKIHIDYRLKFLYWFISSISIIYGNTTHRASQIPWLYSYSPKISSTSTSSSTAGGLQTTPTTVAESVMTSNVGKQDNGSHSSWQHGGLEPQPSQHRDADMTKASDSRPNDFTLDLSMVHHYGPVEIDLTTDLDQMPLSERDHELFQQVVWSSKGKFH